MQSRISELAFVTLGIADGVARIGLNRPERLNALGLRSARELLASATTIAARNDVRVVTITGAGGVFCAGGDVVEMAGAADRERYLRALTTDVHAALAILAELPVVVVAGVNGTVAGGGLGVMLAGDLVIAEAGTRFVSAYAGIGLSPDCGATTLVPEAIGTQRAMEFFLTGRVLSADEALAWGLITETVAAGGLGDRIDALASAIARSTRALGQTRMLLRRTQAAKFREHLESESLAISALAGSETSGALIREFVSR